jgi:16S rRNA processing protein RimM
LPTDAEQLVPIGRVGRPHGLDGAFVVEDASDDPRWFEAGAELRLDGEPATVVLARRAGGGRRAIKLDRTAERGAQLAVRRADLPEPGPDSYYVQDLVGLAVVEEGGRALGTVRDVYAGPANDALELDTGLLLPLIEDCVLSVDLDARNVVVARGFAEDG